MLAHMSDVVTYTSVGQFTFYTHLIVVDDQSDKESRDASDRERLKVGTLQYRVLQPTAW